MSTYSLPQPGTSAGTKPVTFGLRIQLLRLSQKLKDEDVQGDTELDVMKSLFRNKMPAEQYANIKKGYELFAYLEDNHFISGDNLQALEAPLYMCGRSAALEGLLPDGESETTAGGHGCPLRGGVLADVEVYSATSSFKVEGLYRQCLFRVGNGIATSDGSLAQLVYLCTELPLNHMNSKKVSSAHELFCHLEQKGLISCWKLSYLYCRLRVLEREDLCKEVEQYMDKARMHVPRITPPAERKLSKDYTRSHSNPESGQPVSNLAKLKTPSLPVGLSKVVRQHSIHQQESITEQDVAALCDDTNREGTEGGGGGGGEDVKTEATDGLPDNCQPNNSYEMPCNGKYKPAVQPLEDVDVMRNIDQQMRRRVGSPSEGEKHPPHTSPPDAPARKPAITFLNQKVYKCLQSTLLSSVPFGILCAVIALVTVMMVVKLLVELSVCGCGTAVLNLVGRGVTHLFIPAIILSIMVKIAEDPRVEEMCILFSREAEPIFEAVIEILSTRKELEELRGKSSVAEKVNYLLNSKLSSIMLAALLQSSIFFAEVVYIGASNFPHFEGVASHVSAVCRLVMICGAFFIHLVTGVAVCLYLFEMRVREYLARVVDMAREKQVESVEQDAEEARKILLERWSAFQTLMTILSLMHIFLLSFSIWSSTPFRCYGNGVTFNETELKQVPISWILWIIISLLCHSLVYNCHSFTTGRVIAVILQLFSMLICLLDHTSPKWGLMIQITNVVYPCASLFWIHVLACRNVYVKALLGLHHGRAEKGQRVHGALLMYNLLTHVRFLFHAAIAVVILLIVPIAVYREYTLLTKGVQPVQ